MGGGGGGEGEVKGVPRTLAYTPLDFRELSLFKEIL